MNDRKIQELTESELKNIIKEGVNQSFMKLGVDSKDPLEMQKDFQHLREWREATHEIQKKGVLTIVAIIIAGGVATLWMGIKHMLNM